MSDPILVEGEEILWRGRPLTGFRKRKSSIIMSAMAFPLLFLVAGSVFIASRMVEATGDIPVPLVIGLGIPTLFAFFFLLIGGWLADAISRRWRRYAVSSQRLFVQRRAPNGKWLDFALLREPKLELNPDGSGAIWFAREVTYMNGRHYDHAFGFEQLEHAKEVHAIMIKAALESDPV